MIHWKTSVRFLRNTKTSHFSILLWYSIYFAYFPFIFSRRNTLFVAYIKIVRTLCLRTCARIILLHPIITRYEYGLMKQQRGTRVTGYPVSLLRVTFLDVWLLTRRFYWRTRKWNILFAVDRSRTRIILLECLTSGGLFYLRVLVMHLVFGSWHFDVCMSMGLFYWYRGLCKCILSGQSDFK